MTDTDKIKGEVGPVQRGAQLSDEFPDTRPPSFKYLPALGELDFSSSFFPHPFHSNKCTHPNLCRTFRYVRLLTENADDEIACII